MVAWNPLIIISFFFKRPQNFSQMLHALSHEVGHNMGAKHDEKTKHCNTTSNYLMSQRLHHISTLDILPPNYSSKDLFNPEYFNSGLFIPFTVGPDGSPSDFWTICFSTLSHELLNHDVFYHELFDLELFNHELFNPRFSPPDSSTPDFLPWTFQLWSVHEL